MIKSKTFLTSAIYLALTSLALAVPADSGSTGGAPAGINLSTLTKAVNFNGVLEGVMAIATSLIALYAGYAGVKWILRMVKGA